VNKFLSGAMRQFLLEVVFYLIWENYCLITSLHRSGTLTVGEKSTASTYDMTLAALGKMRQMLTTILAHIHAIRFDPEDLDLITSDLMWRRIISARFDKCAILSTDTKRYSEQFGFGGKKETWMRTGVWVPYTCLMSLDFQFWATYVLLVSGWPRWFLSF
jgi:hypothetical protein